MMAMQQQQQQQQVGGRAVGPGLLPPQQRQQQQQPDPALLQQQLQLQLQLRQQQLQLLQQQAAAAAAAGHMHLPGGSTFPQLPGGFQQLPGGFPQLPQQQQPLPFGVATAGPWMTPVTLTPISQPPHPMAASTLPPEPVGRRTLGSAGGDGLLLATEPRGGGGEGWEVAARQLPAPFGEGGGGGRPVGPRGPRSGLLAGASRRQARLPVQQAVQRLARPLATRRLPPSFPRGVLQPEEEEEEKEEGGVEMEGGGRGGSIVSGRRHRRHRRQASSVSAGPPCTVYEEEAAVPAIYEEGEENGRKGCRNLRVSWFVWVQRSLQIFLLYGLASGSEILKPVRTGSAESGVRPHPRHTHPVPPRPPPSQARMAACRVLVALGQADGVAARNISYIDILRSQALVGEVRRFPLSLPYSQTHGSLPGVGCAGSGRWDEFPLPLPYSQTHGCLLGVDGGAVTVKAADGGAVKFPLSLPYSQTLSEAAASAPTLHPSPYIHPPLPSHPPSSAGVPTSPVTLLTTLCPASIFIFPSCRTDLRFPELSPITLCTPPLSPPSCHTQIITFRGHFGTIEGIDSIVVPGGLGGLALGPFNVGAAHIDDAGAAELTVLSLDSTTLKVVH